MKKSIIRKNVLILILTLVVALCLISGYSFFNAYSHANDKVNNTNRAALLQMHDKMENFNRSCEYITQIIINNENCMRFITGDYPDEEKNYFFSELQTTLNDASRILTYPLSIYLFSENTNFVVGTSAAGDLLTFYDTSWLETYRGPDAFSDWTRRTVLSRTATPENRNVWNYLRKFPLDIFGNYGGAVIFTIDEAALRNVLYSPAGSPDETFCLLNRNGNALFFGQTEVFPNITEQLAAVTDTVSSININGASFTSFSYDPPLSQWKYICFVPQNVFRNAVLPIAINLIIILSALIFLTFRLYAELNRKVIVPVDSFIRHISEQHGNTDLKAILSNIITESENVTAQISENIGVMRWKLLSEIITETKTEYKDVAMYFPLLNFTLHPNNYIVMICEFDKLTQEQLDKPDKSMHAYAQTLYNHMNDALNKSGINNGVAVRMSGDRILALISYIKKDASLNIEDTLAYADSFRSFSEKVLGNTISVGVGGFYVDFENIAMSYKEADYALNFKFLSGRNSTITIESVSFAGPKELDDIIHAIEALKTTKRSALEERINEIFESFSTLYVMPEIIRQYALQIIINLFVNTEGVSQKDVSHSKSIHEGISLCQSLDELRAYVMSVLKSLQDIQDTAVLNSCRPVMVTQITEHLRKNYSDPSLSLESVSNHFNINPAFLSRYFKETSGENFLEYLTEIRIARAKELLTERTMKISQIAQTLGYSTHSGFSRIFKQYTGMTPKQYQDICGKSAPPEE